MPYKVEKIPGEPVLVFTLWGTFELLEDQEKISQEISDLIKDIDGSYFMIDDYSGIVNVNFGDMIAVMAEQTKRNLPGSITDPRAKHVLVGSNAMIDFAAKSFNQPQYGGFTLPMYTSLDEALAYVRSQK
jgi:hypothetical protein